MKVLSLFLADEAATQALGEDLALCVRPGDCLAMSGDLGAGKTALSRALIRALAGEESIEVPSPTFTLVQTYALRIPIAHFDLYRIADESEVAELGLDEALETGTALIEWPERAADLLPEDTVRIALTHEGQGRRFDLTTTNNRFAERLKRVTAIRAFLDARGYRNARRRFLTGDSSFRAYERIETEDGDHYVLMDSPERSNGPPIRDGKPYSQLVHLAENVKPFIAVDLYLRDAGLSAPEIHEVDAEQGILLIEDLGSEGVIDSRGRPIPDRYEEAVRCLADFHGRTPPESLPVPGYPDHVLPAFERDTLKFECEVLLDWHVAWCRGEPPDAQERRDYLEIWDHLIDELQDAERRLVLRDYHSPNLLWLSERKGFSRIGIIDFQDAIIGPSAYDVVSITQDARVTVERSLMQRLLDVYLAARAGSGDFDRTGFLKSYAIMSAQRACRLNGLWVRLDKRDNMPGYMRHMPRTLWHLGMAFEHATLEPLRNWCEKAGVKPRSEPLD